MPFIPISTIYVIFVTFTYFSMSQILGSVKRNKRPLFTLFDKPRNVTFVNSVFLMLYELNGANPSIIHLFGLTCVIVVLASLIGLLMQARYASQILYWVYRLSVIQCTFLAMLNMRLCWPYFWPA